jgi:hypothetical protein
MNQIGDNVRLLIVIVIINDVRLFSEIVPRKLQRILRFYLYISALSFRM